MTDHEWRRSGLVLGPRRLAVAVVAVAALVSGALIWGSELATPEGAAPAEGAAVDAGFLRDMKAHHAQAVEMSLLVRERTDDPIVRQIALDVLLGQQQQIGQMYGWLASRELPQTTTEPPMSWMPMTAMDDDEDGAVHGDVHGDGLMPGMATESDLDALRDAEGLRAARLYVDLMISHHESGVAMAEAATESAADPFVRELAVQMVRAQSVEIRQLEDLGEQLAARADGRGGDEA